MKSVSPELSAAVRLLASLIPADCEECTLSVRRDGRASIEVADAMFRGVRGAKLDTLESGEVVQLEGPARGSLPLSITLHDGAETYTELSEQLESNR